MIDAKEIIIWPTMLQGSVRTEQNQGIVERRDWIIDRNDLMNNRNDYHESFNRVYGRISEKIENKGFMKRDDHVTLF